jgi:hypothetical protein
MEKTRNEKVDEMMDKLEESVSGLRGASTVMRLYDDLTLELIQRFPIILRLGYYNVFVWKQLFSIVLGSIELVTDKAEVAKIRHAVENTMDWALDSRQQAVIDWEITKSATYVRQRVILRTAEKLVDVIESMKTAS